MSEGQAGGRPVDDRTRAGRDGLTPAEARALSRSTPLTPAEFVARGRLAEQRFVSLRGVLDDRTDVPRGR